ncbi:hypothetical protein ACNKHP_21335 [Shigella boydii]
MSYLPVATGTTQCTGKSVHEPVEVQKAGVMDYRNLIVITRGRLPTLAAYEEARKRA